MCFAFNRKNSFLNLEGQMDLRQLTFAVQLHLAVPQETLTMKRQINFMNEDNNLWIFHINLARIKLDPIITQNKLFSVKYDTLL